MNERHFEPERPTASELVDLDDLALGDLVFSYADAVVGKAVNGRFEAFGSLPSGAQYVYSTMLLEQEVESGGFNQYFFSSASDYSLEALRGYRKISAFEHARVLRRALTVFHDERWFHYRTRMRRSLESFMDSYQHTMLGEIDSEFFELNDDPGPLRADFIRGHLEQFSRPA